ncbi:hypothetical protein KCU80_g17311, partial [Aureobasidium melanogenum]
MAAIVLPAARRHTSTVIVMHGLGDSGHGWSFLADMWKGKFEETSFIFPHAPEIPISVNMGMRMPGWYDIVRPRNSANVCTLSPQSSNTLKTYRPCKRDITDFAPQMSFDDIQQHEDEAGITRSQAYIHSLIAKEIEKGIPSERIVLGGFSQGGAMSLMSGVTAPTRLGGIF